MWGDAFILIDHSFVQTRAGVLNPNTPLAFLPPREAGAHEFLRNFWVAVAAVWTWDVLCSLSEEYRLLTKFRLTFAQMLYVFSRLSTAACVYTALAFVVADVDDCNALLTAVAALISIAPLFSSFLMFLRLHAVYLDCPWLIRALFVFWLLCSASLFGTTIPAFHAKHMGPTRMCVINSVHSVAGIGIILNAVHDTVFFLAISNRLLQMHQYGDTWKMRLRSFFGGNEPHLSGVRRRGLTHALLRSGQRYYLITVSFGIVTAVLPFLTHLPPDLRLMFSMPNVALQNAMMCRVYRQLKLGLIVDYDLEHLNLDAYTNSSSRRAPQPSNSHTAVGCHIGAEVDLESGRRAPGFSEETSETVVEGT